MSRRLIIEYEGTDTLAVTLMESAMKNIHESAGGMLITLVNEESKNIDCNLFPVSPLLKK